MKNNRLKKVFEFVSHNPVDATMIGASLVMASVIAFSDKKPDSNNACKNVPANSFCIDRPYRCAAVRG